MLSCRDVSELVSKSMDKRLAFRERWAVKMHLMLCKMCRRYARQLDFLQRVASQYESRSVGDCNTVRLSAEARQRIKCEMDHHVGLDSR